MKLLLLSCNTGEGHNSAARAVMEAAGRQGAACELADPVAFGGDRASAAVADLYNNMIKSRPRLFGAVYKAGDLFERTGLPSPVYFANALYARNLHEYLVSGGFHGVICTHLYGMEAMTAVRRRAGNSIPCCGVLTDYTCIPFFGEPELDGYFLPHKDLRQELMGKGVPSEKITATGIPVSAGFAEPLEKGAARAALGFSPDSRVYLVMTGGVGCGDIGSQCEELLRGEEGDFQICVLTGRNEEMKAELTERYGANPRVRIVPFTDEVPRYMAAADVMLSKPGGLSSTEAAVAGIPLVHVLAIPGCETKNAEFFARRGMALKAENPRDAAQKARYLAGDRAAAAQMRAAQRENTHPDAAGLIVERTLRKIAEASATA